MEFKIKRPETIIVICIVSISFLISLIIALNTESEITELCNRHGYDKVTSARMNLLAEYIGVECDNKIIFVKKCIQKKDKFGFKSKDFFCEWKRR